MNLNFNAIAEVRLTEAGMEIFENYKKIEAYSSNDAKAKTIFEIEAALDGLISEGVLRAPLWKLFKIFGPEINSFMDIPFVDNNIAIVENEQIDQLVN